MHTILCLQSMYNTVCTYTLCDTQYDIVTDHQTTCDFDVIRLNKVNFMFCKLLLYYYNIIYLIYQKLYISIHICYLLFMYNATFINASSV